MNPVLRKLSEIGIVPVIKIDDAEKAVPLAKALAAGGLPCAEITFRTAQGEEAIRRIAKEVPEVLVGAGTVLTTEQVDRAIAAGAKFIVSPGFNRNVVAYCIEKNIPVTPGCANPSDVEQAIELGLDVVKFFPVEQAGGINYIKAIAAPYANMMFMPTGGIHAANVNDYLANDKILCCGGSWMVKDDLIQNARFEEITTLCKEAVHTMLGFELAHVGINEENTQNAVKTAKMFEAWFGFACREGNRSVYADKYIEVMKTPFKGKNGHIAISTNSVDRAVAHLERLGVEFDYATEKKDAKGKIIALYMKEEISGFAVHLVEKKNKL